MTANQLVTKSITGQTEELCKVISEDSGFRSLHAKVEIFLSDEASRESYRILHEKGAELQDKQRIGVELSPQEMTDFELSREELLQNRVVVDFMEAQKQLQGMQKMINDYVSKTIENGKVPTEAEILEAQSSGCCGGGCGC